MALPTPTQLSKKFDAFQKQYTGKRVKTRTHWGGNSGKSPYQCVELIKKFAEIIGFNSDAWGNAIKFWYDTRESLDKITDRVTNGKYLKGDVIVFETNQKRIVKGSGAGHVGLYTGNQTKTHIQVLEQNGSTGSGNGKGGNAIRTRYITKKRIAGALRFKTQPEKHYERVKKWTWFVRTKPGVGRRMGVVKGGQKWDTQVLKNGWRKINFKGKPGYVGPAAWRKK